MSAPKLQPGKTAELERKFVAHEVEALQRRLHRREIALQYIQSVLVWNLPAHFVSLLLLVYLLTALLEVLALQLHFFGAVAAALIVAPLLPAVRKALARSLGGRVDKTKGNYTRGWLVWPEDANDFSSDTYPLGWVSIAGKVKLLSWQQLLEQLAQWQFSLRRSVQAVRVLRYASPTQFMVNVWVLCAMGAIMSSFLSGRSFILLVVYSVLLAPGVTRRKLIPKLLRKLSTTTWGRKVVALLTVENPNLDETSTHKIMFFVNEVESTEKKRVPKVQVKNI